MSLVAQNKSAVEGIHTHIEQNVPLDLESCAFDQIIYTKKKLINTKQSLKIKQVNIMVNNNKEPKRKRGRPGKSLKINCPKF